MFWWAVAIALAVLLLVAASWAYRTATRLDRLHVRYDLSWHALDAALARRAVVARAVAADAFGASAAGRRLVAMADAAEQAPRRARETAENQLTGELATIDPGSLNPGLVAELADAEERVLLARRFHNDAVRDTLALREQRLVRWLRLGGTAALPSYFEIAERAQVGSGDDAALVDLRTSARVVLLDETGRVLLLCGSDPAVTDGTAPKWWFTVGGQVRHGETLGAAAVRELLEETGFRADPDRLIGPLWRRDAIFEFNDTLVRSHELFFVYGTTQFEPSAEGHTPLERRYIHGHRWCGADDIARLVAAGESVYPLQLAELLPEAVSVADGSGSVVDGDPQPIR